MPPNLGGFFMVRSYYPSECHADYFDFERIEALKPAIEACGISTFSQSTMLGFHNQMDNRIKLLEQILSFSFPTRRSSDLGLCDRVIVMSRGHAVATFDGDDVTEEKIVHAAISSTRHAAEAAKRERGAPRLARFIEGDYAPVIVLAVVMLALGVYILNRNHRYT